LKIHPNDFLLEEFLLSLSREHLEMLDHFASCATCRRRFQGWMRHRTGPVARKLAEVLPWPVMATDYASAFKGTEPALWKREHLLTGERADAPALFVELTRMTSPEQRQFLLDNSSRFHTWGVFELTVERSLETSIRNPAQGEELGLLAIRLAELLSADRYGAELIEDLRARAWSYIGNARRLMSDLQGAETAFAQAYDRLEAGTRDPLERAVLLDLEASLRRDQRQFEEARRLLRRAISMFLQNDQKHKAGRSMVNLATVHHFAGNLSEAIPLLYQALDFVDPEEEPRLLLCARHNLIDDLAESSRFLEAQSLYRSTRPLYRSFPDAWTQNRRKWVKGKISRGLGQIDHAESLFLAARDGFLGEGIPYDTALVSLELASLYARQGRTADLKRLAAEIVPIFSSLNIHREALAALAFLHQAVETERASEALVASVAAFLRQARHDPALRFREGGE
jgi:tetratricopeptide (TPR) repeat protein